LQLGIGHRQEAKGRGPVIGEGPFDFLVVVGADGNERETLLRKLLALFRERLELLSAMQAAVPEEEEQEDGSPPELGQRVLASRGIFQLPIGGGSRAP
jgi:hypothetical protein